MPVIDELPSTEEEELVLVCDSSLITLEFVNKLSYETLFTIPVIAESSPEYSASQQTIIAIPELINSVDAACSYLEFQTNISLFNADDLGPSSDWLELN